MPLASRSERLPASRLGAWFGVLIALGAAPGWAAGAILPSSPDSYLREAVRVRQSSDRPWLPAAGQLGNLRHLQIVAPDCIVRIASGTENRVLPGTRDVVVVERSRVLDSDPNEQPAPRDVALALDRAGACPSVGSCGVSITSMARAPANASTGPACFTVQLATAHDLLLGGDGLSLLVDRLRQPALRIRLNPSAGMRVWLEQIDIGLLSIDANAPVQVGGSGAVDFLSGGSSNSGSVMFLQTFKANHVHVMTTTTGTHWSIHIGPDTEAGYYQPARAPGAIAEKYGIEIDGPIDRLEVPAGRVDPHPLSEATRIATRALRDEVIGRAGPAPQLPASVPALASAKISASALSSDPNERVAQVVARYLPASIRITHVALWKQGGRLEGMAPDAGSARDAVKRMANSGEFTYISGGTGIQRDGGQAFSVQMYFSCDAPGEPSTCPAGDSASSGAYSEAQVRDAIEASLGTSATVRSVRLNGDTIELKAEAPNVAEARAALERLGHQIGLFRLSTSTYGASSSGSSAEFGATLKLTCSVPPKPDGICTVRTDE